MKKVLLNTELNLNQLSNDHFILSTGKIILSGEHSVTYGKPALVTAVDLRLTVHLSEGEQTITDNKLHEAFLFVEDIILKHLKKTNEVAKKPIAYSYESQIPIGRGMGSSAAFCVATVAALLHFYSGKNHDKQLINSLAYQAEKYFHGSPSGVDVSASCFGGLIFYRKEFEFLKHISALNFKMPAKFQEHLILIDSGEPIESTSEMIKIIGQNYNKEPKKMEQLFADIEKVTKRMVISTTTENEKMFTESIQDNEQFIEEVGLVSTETINLLKSLAEYGIGKVTGAGGLQKGSGMIIFYAANKEKFTEYLTKQKITYFPFQQDFDGVTQVTSVAV